MELRVGDGPTVRSNNTVNIPLDVAQQEISITFNDRNKFPNTDMFTVLVRDLDEPSTIHYLVINAFRDIYGQGTMLYPYTPPQHVGHRYIYEIYRQTAPIDTNNSLEEANLARVAFITVVTQPAYKTSFNSPVKWHGFVKGLSGSDAKYCTCTIEVEAKGRDANPYAVCSKSTGGHVRECGDYYDYEVMPLEYLLVYANRHNIPVADRTSRRAVIDAIYQWKRDY